MNLICRRILSLVPSTLLILLRLCDKSPSHLQNTDKEHYVIQWWQQLMLQKSSCSSNPLLPTHSVTRAGESTPEQQEGSCLLHWQPLFIATLCSQKQLIAFGQWLDKPIFGNFLSCIFYSCHYRALMQMYVWRLLLESCNLLDCINSTTADYDRQKLSWQRCLPLHKRKPLLLFLTGIGVLANLILVIIFSWLHICHFFYSLGAISS